MEPYEHYLKAEKELKEGRVLNALIHAQLSLYVPSKVVSKPWAPLLANAAVEDLINSEELNHPKFLEGQEAYNTAPVGTKVGTKGDRWMCIGNGRWKNKYRHEPSEPNEMYSKRKVIRWGIKKKEMNNKVYNVNIWLKDHFKDDKNCFFVITYANKEDAVRQCNNAIEQGLSAEWYEQKIEETSKKINFHPTEDQPLTRGYGLHWDLVKYETPL